MLEYEHSELSQEKEEMDLAELYNQAFSSYKGEVNYEPVQLINEKGHFMTISNKQGANKKTSEQTMNGLMGAIQGIDNNEYKVISIFGPQSSGKSYLMNQVFGTGFDTKDRDVNQKTRGVWLARSSVVKDLLVIDCEGTGGSERTEQEGIEKQMAERGMLFSLLVSQIVIFNIDKAQLNTEADRAILTNIVNYYMDNRKAGCPPLRMIISVRNVDSRIRLTEVNRLANGIVEEAYHKNQRKTKEKLNEIFEIEVFWFGNFDYEGDNPYKHLKYTLEEHSQNDEILGAIGPLFADRLKLFQKRFTNPEHSRYFLKGLIPIVDISGLPLYLHQFWNIVRDVEGVSITNVLDLVFEQQVKYVTEQLTKNYKEMWNDLIKEIKNEDSESSERISERVSDYVKLKHKESTESLEKSVPNYGHSEALKEANNYLLGMLSEIDAKLIKHLMANLAATAANSLQGKIESLLSENTHKQEADALKLIDKTIKSIQLIDLKKDIKSWANSLLELQKDTAERAKEQQRNRVNQAVLQGVQEMSDHEGDFVEKVRDLATAIAESEGFENEEGRVTALEGNIAETWNTQVTSASRRDRVKKVFTDRYKFKEHVVNADHIDNIRNEANAEKDRLVKFRKHFHDRIEFQDTADAWDQEMKDVIEHEHTTKKIERDAHVFEKSFSIQTQSLKTALAVISILYFLSDPSIMFGIFLFFFYLIAANGMLSEKLLHIGEWIGFIRQFMSFSGIIKMVINAIRGAVVPLIASS